MPEIVTSSTDMPSSLADAIGIGTLTRLVPRELVDEVVASEGRKEIRKNKLPARVMVYFVMAMALFYGDSYEEVMRKLADGLDYMGTWREGWETPSPGGLCPGLLTWSEIWCDVENSKSFRSSRHCRVSPGHRLKGASALHNFLASIFTAPGETTWSDMSGNARKNQVTILVTLRHRSTMSGALVPVAAL